MDCPFCGRPMEEGVLDSRGPVRWTENATGMSVPARSGDVILGKAFGFLRPKAYLCRKCQRVIADC